MVLGDFLKGFWSIEALFITFLLPHLFFIASIDKLIIPRETAEVTHDLAELYSNGHLPSEILTLQNIYTVWIDAQQFFPCNYTFKYCTQRFIRGEVVKICAAACSI